MRASYFEILRPHERTALGAIGRADRGGGDDPLSRLAAREPRAAVRLLRGALALVRLGSARLLALDLRLLRGPLLPRALGRARSRLDARRGLVPRRAGELCRAHL